MYTLRVFRLITIEITALRVTCKTAITLTPPTGGRWVAGRYFARFWMCFLSADGKKIKTTQLYFFHRPTVLMFWSSVWHRPIIGRLSTDRRPTIGRILIKNKPFNLGRLSADHRPKIGRRSADDLFIGRSSTYCRPTKLIVGRLSADRWPS